MIVELDIVNYFMQVLRQSCVRGWLVFYTSAEKGRNFGGSPSHIADLHLVEGYEKQQTENKWDKITPKMYYHRGRVQNSFKISDWTNHIYDGDFYAKWLILLFCAQTTMTTCQIEKALADLGCQGRVNG